MPAGPPRRVSCWACWEERDDHVCTTFVPASALPDLVHELARPAEIAPVLCAHCLLAGVTLQRRAAEPVRAP